VSSTAINRLRNRSRSGSRRSAVVNSRQNNREISATSRLQRDRRIAQNGRRENFCRTDLARFPVWADAGKARDALRLTTRIYTYRVQQSASGAVSQAVNGCAAHPSSKLPNYQKRFIVYGSRGGFSADQ